MTNTPIHTRLSILQTLSSASVELAKALIFKFNTRTFRVMALLFLVPWTYASATSIEKLAFDEMVQQSELVVEGRVVASEARWNNSRTKIQTHVTIAIDEVVIGNYSKPNLQLRFMGGVVGPDEMRVQGLQYPMLEREVFTLLNRLAEKWLTL